MNIILKILLGIIGIPLFLILYLIVRVMMKRGIKFVIDKIWRIFSKNDIQDSNATDN